jgi:O-antigen/teichoic acid export membrane protein
MTLHRQAVSLAILQAAEILQPLLILPYAGRVFGAAAFGEYAYALILTQYGSLFVDYGFYFTSRRAAAAARHDPIAVKRLLAEVVTAKAVLCIGLALAGLAALSLVPSISLPMLLCVVIAAFGGTLSPTWLFIAIEQPWQAAVCVVTARGLALVAFLTMVTSPSDIYLAASIQAAIPLVSAVVGLPFVLKIGLSGFRSVTLQGVIMQLRQGWRAFISNLAFMAVILLQVPLVRHFAGFAAAGQYAVAERLISVARPVFRVILETLMPRVAYLAAHDPLKGLALVRRSLLTLVIGVSMSLVLYFAGPYAITLLFGADFSGSIPILHTLCIMPILINISLCTSDLYMFHFGYEKAWSVLIVAGLPVFLTTSYVLSFWTNGALAVAFGVVASACLVALVSASFFASSLWARRRHLHVLQTADEQTAKEPATGTEPKSSEFP